MINDTTCGSWINDITFSSDTSSGLTLNAGDTFTGDFGSTVLSWPEPIPDYYEWPKGVWCPTDKEYHPEWHIKKSYKLQVERMWK